MNEDILQYFWRFKQFAKFNFLTTDLRKLEILDFGEWNINSGPDFLLAKIKIDDLVFVGNIEIHTKASDWKRHQHQNNPDFSNIILHVVYDKDCEIPEFLEAGIPTLELKNYINPDVINKHLVLKNQFNFIACETIFKLNKVPILFAEENLFKRLDAKAQLFENELKRCNNNYEALLFRQLAYGFGLRINSDIFLQISELIDIAVINKIKQNLLQLEALLFGLSNWLEENMIDEHPKIWKREFEFLKSKFKLTEVRINPKFSKLRPHNFPTLRWSQFANLYSSQQNLFSKLIFSKSIDEVKELLKAIKASEYWDNHFTFDKESKQKVPKKISDNFIDLILINTILPMIYFYHKKHDSEINDRIIEFYQSIKAEKNSILEHWENLGIKFENSLQTQAFLYQYKTLCNHKKCLNCVIGFNILKDDR